MRPPLPPHFMIKKAAGRRRRSLTRSLASSQPSTPSMSAAHDEINVSFFPLALLRNGGQIVSHGKNLHSTAIQKTCFNRTRKLDIAHFMFACRFIMHFFRSESQPNQKSCEPQQRTSWHSSRAQQNPASVEHTLTSPRPCTSSAGLDRQMVRLLQTILIRVEHQGTQLDAISARLCDASRGLVGRTIF
ncbi:unnamed protein product [Ixodes pacificus]